MYRFNGVTISIGIGITITTLKVYKTMSYNPAGDRSEVINSVQLWNQGLDTWDEVYCQYYLYRCDEFA